MNFLRLDYAPAEAYLQSNKHCVRGEIRINMGISSNRALVAGEAPRNTGCYSYMRIRI